MWNHEQLDARVALLRLFHEPPLVATIEVLVAGKVHVGWLGAFRCVCVTTNLPGEANQHARVSVVHTAVAFIRLRSGQWHPCAHAMIKDQSSLERIVLIAPLH
jgi:hypothetical protein